MTTPVPESRPDYRHVDGRRIVVALTGGIACYKMAEVVSRLAQAGAEVTVLMTDAATKFVGPLTFQALSARPVYTSPWEHIESQDPQHISLARDADLMVIAPCTMDTLARLVHGSANDVVTLVCAGMDRTTQPTLIAPAMNAAMWAQPSTQRNVAQLKDDGFDFIGPDEGWQACRTSGPGRMSEPAAILARIDEMMSTRASGS